MKTETIIRQNFSYFLDKFLLEEFITDEVLRLVGADKDSFLYPSLTERFLELNKMYVNIIKFNQYLNSSDLNIYKKKILNFIDSNYLDNGIKLDIMGIDIDSPSELKILLDKLIKINSTDNIEITIPINSNGKYNTSNLESISVFFEYLNKDYTITEKKLINLIKKVAEIIGFENFCIESKLSPKSHKTYYSVIDEQFASTTELSSDLNIRILMNVFRVYSTKAKIY